MYSRKALLEIFHNIIQFEVRVKNIYDDCIERLDDRDIINTLQSISNEEKEHLALAKPLLQLIKE